MQRVFAQGLASPVGTVLPLRRVLDRGARRWQTGKWFFRSDTLFLLPGDSPIGLRLPLESLPWADPDTIEPQYERDPFEIAEKLPAQAMLRARRAEPAGPGIEDWRPQAQALPEVGRGEPELVRDLTLAVPGWAEAQQPQFRERLRGAGFAAEFEEGRLTVTRAAT